jgi:hypothetical protein
MTLNSIGNGLAGFRRGWTLISLTVLLAMLGGRTMAEEPPGRLMLVIDSSLAMQGALGNETKMEAAKNALGLLLQRYDGKLDLGLATYGSRKAKACSDVTLLSPPQPLKAGKIARLLTPLKPAGSAPLAQVLADAATALGPAAASDRLLLVAGGPDGCKADPCAVAKQARAARRIKIDVVALRGSAGDDMKPLRCIAKLSGGAYYEVANAAKLVAAIDKVLGQVSGGNAPATAAAEAPAAAMEGDGGETQFSGMTLSLDPETPGAADEAVPEATAPAPAAGPVAKARADGKVPMLFSALIAEPGPRIDSGLTWRIYDRKAGDDGLHALVARSEDATPRLPLPPGDYMVNVAYGRAYLTRSIKVAPGLPARQIFVLNAGGLRLSAKALDGQEITGGAVVNEIYSDERDQGGNRALVAGGIKPGIILRLNAGIYHVKSVYGGANGIVQGDISIEAGRLTDMTLTHEAASVTLKLVAQVGGEALADTQWRIYLPDGALVSESVGALPTHILAPGRYNVEAVRAGQKYAEVFDLAPGRARTVEVVLPQE